MARRMATQRPVGRGLISIPRRLVAILLALLLLVAGSLALRIGQGGALTLTSSDGYTSVMPDPSDGTVTPDTPYDSGQAIDVVVTANPVINAAGLAAASLPDTGTFYVIECSDTGGTSAGLPTSVGQCDNGTLTTTPKAADGSVNQTGGNAFPVYSLPTAATNFDTTATCGLSPNPCVVAIFAVSPSAGGFADPHLFSAPFDVSAGDGSNTGDNPGDGSAPVTTATSPTNSTVLTSQAILAADGSDTSKITVTLKDTNGAAVTTGKQVSLSQGSGHSTIDVQGVPSTTATTDASGQAVFSVTDTTAEPVTYTVTDTSDSNLQLSTQPTITFATPTVTPANSSITANPTAVAQAGSSTITVTLDDQATAPQPLAGKLVTLAQGPGGSVITPASPGSDTTNIQGKATFTVTDTTAQTVTYTATGDGVALTGHSASVTFGTLTASATASLVTADNPVVSSVANGGSQPTGGVTVTLLAADGVSAVEGKTITLAASPGSSALVSPSSAVTDANGQAVFSVSDTTAESVTFTATDTTDQLPIIPTATVTFEAGPADANQSSVTADPSTVPNDGHTASTITVGLHDQQGNPVAGKLVTLTASSSSPVITAVSPVTDAGGNATFAVTDVVQEVVTFTAVDSSDNLTLAQAATIDFKQPTEAGQSTITVNQYRIPANGVTPAVVSVTLRDGQGNPLDGMAVSAQAAPADGAEIVPVQQSDAPAAGVTDAQGRATFWVFDAKAEVVTITATDTTDGVAVTQSVPVVFTAGLPQPAQSSVTASPLAVPSDGHTTSLITVTLHDSYDNPVPGKSITLSGRGGAFKVSPISEVTDQNGQATLSVSDSTSEYVTFAAEDTTDSLAIGTATVTFGTPPPTGENSTFFASPSSVPDDGTTASTITVFLRDEDRRGVSGRTVVIHAAGGHSALDHAFAVTDANGEATFHVTDATSEQVDFTAVDATDNLTLPTTVQVTFQGSMGSIPSGPVSWVANGSNAPFSSGQFIEVTVGANSTLPAGSGMYIEECAAPGGVIPTAPSQCDPKTAQTQELFTNSDGSASYMNYAVFALPDLVSLGEPASGGPTCNLSSQCVFYLGENPTNFSLPHLWSSFFYVNPGAGTDNGANPGNGLPEVPYVLALPLLAVGILIGFALIRRRRSRVGGF